MFETHNNPWESSSKSEAEAYVKEMKAQRMIVIREITHNKGLTARDLQTLLGFDQGRVSHLLNGNISKFSIDKLEEVFYKLGYYFDMKLKDGVPMIESHEVEALKVG